MRIQRDFFARDQIDQEYICENTWCDTCDEADIGLLNPVEFEEDGRVFVEGACARCRGRIVTEITEHSVGD
jgi:hypothetical protein